MTKKKPKMHTTLELVDIERADAPKLLIRRHTKVPANWKKGAKLREKMIQALRDTQGNVSRACAMIGVSRTSFNYHRDKYPEFNNRVIEVMDSLIDEAESALMDQIRGGNSSATIFFLKTRGRDRGYIEQTSHKEERNINVNFSYDVTESKQLDKVRDMMEAQIIEQARKLENGEL